MNFWHKGEIELCPKVNDNNVIHKIKLLKTLASSAPKFSIQTVL